MTDLDFELDRQLHDLPAPKAPATLLPRILVATGRLDRSPWYARPWVAWPRELQVASAAMVMLVIAAIILDLPVLHWISPRLSSGLGAALDPIRTLVSQVSTLTRVFWHVWLEPLALYLIAVFVLVSLAVAAALSIVNRVTPEQV